MWQPAEGGPAVSAEEWEAGLAEAPGGNGEPAAGESEGAEAEARAVTDGNADADADAKAPAPAEAEIPADSPPDDTPAAPSADAVEVPAEGGTESRADEE